MHLHLHSHLRLHFHVHSNLHLHLHSHCITYKSTYRHTYLLTYLRTYMHTYIHTHTPTYVCIHMHLPGPPKEPKIMAQHPQIERIGSLGSIIRAILDQVHLLYIHEHRRVCTRNRTRQHSLGPSKLREHVVEKAVEDQEAKDLISYYIYI